MALPDYPITRNEQYLNNIATGSGELPEFPLSREEQYLAYIAEHGGGGGGNVPDPTVDDIGKVVGAVADGTGAKLAYVEGGGGLPPVTGSGKALVSVDGEWVEQSGYPYEESGAFDPITWDGDTTGKESVNNQFWKMTDEPISISNIIGAEIIVQDTQGGQTFTKTFVITLEMVNTMSETLYMIVNDGNYIIVATDDTDFSGLFITKGVWLACSEIGTVKTYVSSLIPPSTIHTIDPKYLPSTIPTTEDVQDMIETAIGDAIAAIPTKAMVVTYDDDTTETFNVLIQSE